MHDKKSSYYPDFSELSDQDVKILGDLNIDSELTILFGQDSTVYTTWQDDSELCFNVSINNVKVSFWYIMPEYFAACLYADESKKALQKFLDLIADSISAREQGLANRKV